MMGGPQDIKDIVAQLQGHARAIVADLYGSGGMKGRRLMLHDLSGNRGDNISVALDYLGPMAPGDFRCFGGPDAGQHGDILDLVMLARFSGNKGEAIKWARSYLGIDRVQDPAALAVERKKLEERQRKAKAEADAASQKRRNAALHIFISAQADIENTPVDHYLAARNIDIRAMPSTGACRYQPDCLDMATGELLPAMVLAVVGGDGKLAGCHRTYLEQVNGVWRVIKKPTKSGKLKSYKMSLGDIMGGHVSVSKGKADVPLGRAPQGDVVLMAEGYETTCVYAMASPELRCISTISLANMASVIMPATVTTRILVKENGMGKEALAAFDKAVAAHQRQCSDVRVIESEQGYSDDNDFLMDKKLAG